VAHATGVSSWYGPHDQMRGDADLGHTPNARTWQASSHQMHTRARAISAQLCSMLRLLCSVLRPGVQDLTRADRPVHHTPAYHAQACRTSRAQAGPCTTHLCITPRRAGPHARRQARAPHTCVSRPGLRWH